MHNTEPVCYEVIVGNIGSVYCGKIKETAVQIFDYYKEHGTKHTRAEESVVLYVDAEPEREYYFPEPEPPCLDVEPGSIVLIDPEG